MQQHNLPIYDHFRDETQLQSMAATGQVTLCHSSRSKTCDPTSPDMMTTVFSLSQVSTSIQEAQGPHASSCITYVLVDSQ
eukprot:845144-Amphidinium_carterae.1